MHERPPNLLQRHPFATALVGYVALAAATSWPLLAHLGTTIAGGPDEGYPTLWRLWWVKEALLTGRWPFRCDLLAWPAGASLAAAGLDLPGALAALPLWLVTSPSSGVLVVNLVALAALTLSGFLVFLLAREVWGGLAGPLLAGALFASGGWQLGAMGSVQAQATPWCVLFLLGFARTLRRRGLAGPLLGALGLVLAAAAVPENLVSCLAGAAALLLGWALRERRALLDPTLLRRAVLLAALCTFAVSWRWGEAGANLAEMPAGVVLGVVPGTTLAARGGPAWAPPGFGHAREGGWLLFGLAAAAVVRSGAARPWFLVGLVRMALAAALDHRCAWLAGLGLAVGAWHALGLLFEWRQGGGDGGSGRRSGRRLGWVLAPAIAAAAVLCAALRAPPPAPSFPASRYLVGLAKDRERWVVLDASSPARALWNATLHAHPLAGMPLDRPGARQAVGREPQTQATTLPMGTPVPGTPRSRPGSLALEPSDLQTLAVRFVIMEAKGGACERHDGPWALIREDGLCLHEVPARAR
jgi:hypothetical protein